MKQELEQIRARREIGHRLLIAAYQQCKGESGGDIMRFSQMAAHLGVSEAELRPVWEKFHREQLIGTLGMWGPGDSTESGIIAIQFLPAGIKAAESIIELKASLGGQAMDYLRQLHKEVRGNPTKDADLLGVGERISLEHERTLAVFDHLRARGLAKEGTDKGCVRITGDGVIAAESEFDAVQVKDHVSRPGMTYNQFGPAGSVAIANGTGPAIATGPVSLSSELIREALSEIAEAKAIAKLSADESEVVDRVMTDLKRQTESGKPNGRIVKGCLQSLRTILEGIASGVATAALSSAVGLSS
jgi:hypothetical protein